MRVRLGGSALEVNRLGVGCWAWGDRRYWRYEEDFTPADVVDAFDACLTAGLDFFDTAEAYGAGHGEKILGWLARKCQRPLVIATKYAPIAGRGGPSALRKGLAGSLKRLGLPHVDLYQLHWADSQEIPIDATMDVLAELVHGGQVRAVGVSNFRAGEMRQAHAGLARHAVPLASNQVHYSLLHRSPEVDGVLDACRELGVTLLAYSPLEQGLLTGKYDADVRPPGLRGEATWFAATNVAAAQPLIGQLRSIAANHAVEPAAVALGWLLAQPDVVPLAGAKNGSQVAANVAAQQLQLTAAEFDELDRASAAWRVVR